MQSSLTKAICVNLPEGDEAYFHTTDAQVLIDQHSVSFLQSSLDVDSPSGYSRQRVEFSTLEQLDALIATLQVARKMYT